MTGDPDGREDRPPGGARRREDGAGPPRDALEAWAEDRYAREDDLLRELRSALDQAGFPLIQVPARTGRLLELMVRATGARRIVEVGTLGGYSAVWMGRALPPGGGIVTLEKEPDHAALARRFLERAGLADRVEVREGDAAELLPGLQAGVWDLVFLDADKERYPRYLEEAARLLRPGGLLLADNAFWRGRVLDDPAEDDAATAGIRAFHETLAGHDAFEATVLPVGDGVAMGVRTG